MLVQIEVIMSKSSLHSISFVVPRSYDIQGIKEKEYAYGGK